MEYSTKIFSYLIETLGTKKFEKRIIAGEGDQVIYFYMWVVKRGLVGQISNKIIIIIIVKCQVLFYAFTCIFFP